jgi:hypothetical protein
VLAELNPASPAYVPPAPLRADDLPLSTSGDAPISGVLAGSSEDYFRIVKSPSNGKVTLLDKVAGTFNYQPKRGYEGTDQFSYVAVNASGKSAPAVVTIQIEGGSGTGGALKTPDGWGVRMIEGVVLTGTYISEDDDEHPFIRLDAPGTGVFEVYGAPAPEHVYNIRWWVEAKADGSLIKQDFPLATLYTLIVEFVDKRYQGLEFDRLSLVVQKPADGKIYIMDRAKPKN